MKSLPPALFTYWTLLASCFLFVSAPAGGQIAELAVDLTPGDEGPVLDNRFSSSPRRFHLISGDRVIFQANDTAFPLGGHPQQSRLWVTEGTASSTRSLAAGGGIVAATKTRVYSREVRFVAEDVVWDLWVTDGTPDGTEVVFEIDFRERSRFAAVGETLFFSVGDRIFTNEGTAASTKRVGEDLDIRLPSALADAGDRLVFTAEPASGSSLPGTRGLWEIDAATGVGRQVFQDESIDLAAQLEVVGGKVFFGGEPYEAPRFWTYDPATETVDQLLPEGAPALGQFSTVRPGEVLFTTLDERGNLELWRTDGTQAGTRPLTHLRGGIRFPTGISMPWVRPVGDDLVFIARGVLWKAGKRPGGRIQLSQACEDLSCQVHKNVLFPFGDDLAFRFRPRGSAQPELWITDGSAAGTVPLSDLCGDSCSDILVDPISEGELLYFIAGTGAQQRQLWRTDGTVAGTFKLTSAPTSVMTSDLGQGVQAPFGFITHLEDAEYGDEPWIFPSDGREASLLRDLAVARATSRPENLKAEGDRALFLQDGNVFAHEGTPGGVARLTDFGEGVRNRGILIGGERAYASLNKSDEVSLWVLGSSVASTRQIGSFQSASSWKPRSLVQCLGSDYFLIPFGESAGLFRVDETGDAIEHIVGPEDVEHSSFRDLICLGDELLYLATISNEGAFYRSDGTAAGTELVERIEFSSAGSGRLSTPISFDGAHYFTACLGFLGDSLWKQESGAMPEVAGPGDVEGFFPACEFSLPYIASPVVFDGEIYYLSRNGDAGVTLRRTDGTLAGAEEVVGSMGRSGALAKPELVVSASGVLFAQVRPASGVELWIANASGARLLKDIQPGVGSSNPSHFTTVGDLIYFAANDGVHGSELWVTDGTETGTRLVHDLYPGAFSSMPSDLTLANDRLYFIADDGLTGRELWFLPLDGRPPCRSEQESLCLAERYKVEAVWEDFQDRQGKAQARPLTDDTGTFYFFDEANLELMVKSLDGRSNNGHVWTFYGALSNVEYHMTVTDTETGLTRRYFNPKRNFASVGDTRSFGPLGASFEHAPEPLEATTGSWAEVTRYQMDPAALGLSESGGCVSGPGRLCLQEGRFAVDGLWTDFRGGSGDAVPIPLTDDTGAFWFFRETNVELLVKVLDGRANNGNFWVFLGSLSNVDFDVRVVDTSNGNVRIYQNSGRRFASFGDTQAFPGG